MEASTRARHSAISAPHWSKTSSTLASSPNRRSGSSTRRNSMVDLSLARCVGGAKRVGHSSPAITLAIYTHATAKGDELAAAVLDFG